MYITRVEIYNIKSIQKLQWKIGAANAPGWHVILGDNGSGKSTFVRSAALAIIGYWDSSGLNQDWNLWSRLPLNELETSRVGTMSAEISMRFDKRFDEIANFKGTVADEVVLFAVGTNTVTREKRVGLIGGRVDKSSQLASSTFAVDPKTSQSMTATFGGYRGCFSAAYGPFRRFTGGDAEQQSASQKNSRLSAFSSAFSEGVTLPDGLQWLREMHFRRLEEKDDIANSLINNITAFINQPGFLPNGSRMDSVSMTGVHFVDAFGKLVEAEELGDGFRSLLSLSFDIIRRLTLVFGTRIFNEDLGWRSKDCGDSYITVEAPGIVFIDEIDAHLHPTWQKQIGFWLTKHFPKIQFIVTTHSPLVCQAAENGTIFRLPTPGTDEAGKMLTGSDRDRLLYGNILDAYSTQAFGFGITRSKRSEEMLDKLSDLNMKEVMEGLTADEMEEQDRLRAMLPTSGSVLPAKFAQ